MIMIRPVSHDSYGIRDAWHVAVTDSSTSHSGLANAGGVGAAPGDLARLAASAL